MWWLCQGIGAWLGLKLERTRCQLLVAVKARYACASTTCSLLPCPGGLSADDEKKHGRSSTCLRHVALFFVQGCYVNRNRNGRGSCERETCGLGWKTGKDQGGLTRADLMESNSGKIVSKKQNAAGKRLHARGLQEPSFY